MLDYKNREIIIGDKVILKRSYSTRFDYGTVVSFTEKKVRVAVMIDGVEDIRTVSMVVVVSEYSNNVIEFMVSSFGAIS